MSTVRIAVLGAGFMGSTHANAYARLPDVEIAAIYAQSEKRAVGLAEQVNSTWVSDLDTILADDSITAVDICLPSPYHRDITAKALAAGKHVLLEKPIALNHEDGAALVNLGEETDRILMIAHVLRFWPEYVEIQRIIESGQLGKPIAALAARRQPFPAWSDRARQPSTTGGAILDQMIHDYDVVNWLFGTPKAVSARGVLSPRTGAYDQSQVLVEYESGSAVIDGGMMMPESYPFTTMLDVLCENGAIEYHFRAGGRSFEIGEPSNELKLFPAEGDPQVIELPQTDAFDNECAYFIECVRENRKPEKGLPAESLVALDVALAAQKSADTGERVILGE